ncbi:hypothetical protein COP2_040931 [Malus domestica]
MRPGAFPDGRIYGGDDESTCPFSNSGNTLTDMQRNWIQIKKIKAFRTAIADSSLCCRKRRFYSWRAFQFRGRIMGFSWEGGAL